MDVGIVGYGIVGKALADTMLLKGHTVYVNDIKDIPPEDSERTNFFEASKCRMAFDCDIIFVCVPTPFAPHLQMLDYSLVSKVINDILKFRIFHLFFNSPIIAVKSTLPIGATEAMSNCLDYPIAYVPEFLRHKTATEDCKHPDRIIIGSNDEGVTEGLKTLFFDFDAPIFCVEPKVAEMAKLFSNAFLSTKVAFSQQIAGACKKFGVEFPVELITSDHRIGNSHLDPYLGKIPRDSPCLPKDLMNLMCQLAPEQKLFSYILDEAVE